MSILLPVFTAIELLSCFCFVHISYSLLLTQYFQTTSLVGQVSRWPLKAANCDCKYRLFHRSKLHSLLWRMCTSTRQGVSYLKQPAAVGTVCQKLKSMDVFFEKIEK